MVRPYISQQPVDDFGLLFSDLLFSVTLAATTDTSLTIPGNAQRYKAIIKTGVGEAWVALNVAATPPGGAVFASTNSEMITNAQKLCREVKAGDVLHFYSTAGALDVSVVLYSVGTNN